MSDLRPRPERVTHQVLYNGKTFIVTSDLIRDDRDCRVVFTWGDGPDGAFPVASVPVDPAILMPLNDGVADWLIESDVLAVPDTFDGIWR